MKVTSRSEQAMRSLARPLSSPKRSALMAALAHQVIRPGGGEFVQDSSMAQSKVRTFRLLFGAR